MERTRSLLEHVRRLPVGLLEKDLERLGVASAEIPRAKGARSVTRFEAVLRRPAVSGPLFDSSLGEKLAPGALERKLRELWAGLEKKPHTAWRLSRQAFGQGKLEHDLYLASVYVEIAIRSPELTWLREEEWTKALGMGARGHELPDALLVSQAGVPVMFIEAATGSYRSDRLSALACFAASQSLPIQFW